MSALLFWLPISVLMVVFGIYVNQNPHIAFVPLTVSNGQSVKELHPQMDYYTIPVKEKRTTWNRLIMDERLKVKLNLKHFEDKGVIKKLQGILIYIEN